MASVCIILIAELCAEQLPGALLHQLLLTNHSEKITIIAIICIETFHHYHHTKSITEIDEG